MISFLKHHQIDKEKWNSAIRNSINPVFFANYECLDLGSPQWCALVKNDYEAVMPLPVNKKYTISYIFTPFFFSRLGIFSAFPIDEEMIYAFIENIPSEYKQVDIIFNSSNLLKGETVFFMRRVSYALSLNMSYSDIRSSYSNNTKRNIAIAQKERLQICEDVAPEEIVTLFKAGRGKTRGVNYRNRDYSLLLRMFSLAREQEQADILGVRDESGNFLAGALFLKDRDRIWFWFSGRNMQFPDKRPMFMIIDEYLKRNENQDKIFDFNGSMNENIARFYQGFGGEPYYYQLLTLRRSFWLSPIIALYKSIKK